MMVKMQHSVQRRCQGYCLSLSGGFSACPVASRHLGFSACPVASRLRGFSACPAAPVASRLLGLPGGSSASRLLGLSGGFAASRLVRWLLGFSACQVASRLLGFSASQLVSYFAASRLLVAFLGPFCPCFGPSSICAGLKNDLLWVEYVGRRYQSTTTTCSLSKT